MESVIQWVNEGLFVLRFAGIYVFLPVIVYFVIPFYVLCLLICYAIGFVRAVRFTAWAYKNLNHLDKKTVTKLTFIKTVFFKWQSLTWIVSDSYLEPKGSRFRVKCGVIDKE